jgi:hypothetical protein
LLVRHADGASASPVFDDIRNRKYVFPASERQVQSVRFVADTTQRGLEVIWQSAGIEHRVACGFREWKKGEATWGNTGTKEPMAASGAWTLPDTYVMKQCFTQTPYHLTTQFRFEDDRVFVDEETNVAFASTKRPQLVGRAE